eukprot:TRINITY_DN66859_c0_g1_i1.p1 TRINITY_DN66859_c0_g1~~TRINITY_DN66859_c0_g1_i1.p1  ORF type:complete len:217 (-),score=34.33 TRINITY_DN66859_c0_g1_i1:193-843(-)
MSSSIVSARMCEQSNESTITVTASLISGRSTKFSLDRKCSCSDLQTLIAEAFHVPPCQQKIILGCADLEMIAKAPLQSLGVEDGARITVLQDHPNIVGTWRCDAEALSEDDEYFVFKHGDSAIESDHSSDVVDDIEMSAEIHDSHGLDKYHDANVWCRVADSRIIIDYVSSDGSTWINYDGKLSDDGQRIHGEWSLTDKSNSGLRGRFGMLKQDGC